MNQYAPLLFVCAALLLGFYVGHGNGKKNQETLRLIEDDLEPIVNVHEVRYFAFDPKADVTNLFFGVEGASVPEGYRVQLQRQISDGKWIGSRTIQGGERFRIVVFKGRKL